MGLPSEPVSYSSKSCGVMVKAVNSGVSGLDLNPKATIYSFTRSNYSTTLCLTFSFSFSFERREEKIGGGQSK